MYILCPRILTELYSIYMYTVLSAASVNCTFDGKHCGYTFHNVDIEDVSGYLYLFYDIAGKLQDF